MKEKKNIYLHRWIVFHSEYMREKLKNRAQIRTQIEYCMQKADVPISVLMLVFLIIIVWLCKLYVSHVFAVDHSIGGQFAS